MLGFRADFRVLSGLGLRVFRGWGFGEGLTNKGFPKFLFGRSHSQDCSVSRSTLGRDPYVEK